MLLEGVRLLVSQTTWFLQSSVVSKLGENIHLFKNHLIRNRRTMNLRLAWAIYRFCISKILHSWAQWCLPLILALGKERQVNFCEFRADLVYIVSSR